MRRLVRLLFRATSHSTDDGGLTEPDEPRVPSPPAPPESPPGKGSSPSRASPDDGESTTDGEGDTDGHDRKTDGANSTPSKGRKEVKGPEPPRNIAGRRNGLTQTKTVIANDSGETRVVRPTSEPRPELICRRPSGSVWWEVLLSVDVPIAAVKQNGEPLSLGNGGWPLTSFAGRLSIDLKQGPPIHVSLFDKSPLIFKLNKDWTGDGRKITRLTKGHFIVIAPMEWVRSGHVPVEPDGCSDSAFMAHYFFRDGSESTEELGGFPGREIASSAPGFELSGKSVFDDSEEGDLFVGTPPRLSHADRVVWVRVGEEGAHDWKGRNFKPSERSLDEVMDARQGRFFLRVYDEQGAMLDSAQFRYLRDLQEIRLNGETYSEDTLLVPTATGHPPTTVRFIGADGVPVRATLRPGAAPVEDGMGGLIAEPHPDADEISCALEADDGRVDIALDLPRIWWRMEREGAEWDGEWCSTPFKMTRHGFRELADSNAILRLRSPKRIRSVVVGFGDEPGLEYTRRDDEFVLPLAHFVNHVQIDHRLTEDALFNVRFDQSNDRRGQKVLTLIRIAADPPPAIVSLICEPRAVAAGEKSILSWVTRNADDVRVVIDPDIGAVEPVGSREIALLETHDLYTLRLTAPGMEDVTRRVTVRVSRMQVAKVRRGDGGGWRPGRGFSCGELCAVGLSVTAAARRSIRIDRRRRSVHPTNIKNLRKVANG